MTQLTHWTPERWRETLADLREDIYDIVHQARPYGAFARAVELPCEVEADNAQADYRRGVLQVTLPKTERAKAKRARIPVHG
jgi:HSP20 family protein